LILVIFSLLLVGIFINFSIGERFDNFINLQREENISELAAVLSENLQNNNFDSVQTLVDNFSRTNRIPIWVENNRGEFIYFSAQHNQMSQMMGRMGMNGNSHLNIRQLPGELPGQTNSEEVIVNGQKLLTLYWKDINPENQLDSDLYNYFKGNIYRAIILSALIVILLIIILSFILSKKITMPLIRVKNAALEVAQGNYQQNIASKGDDELAELVDAFNLMSKKLLKLEKIRKESASDLAHELRTPLTTIKGYLEAIEDGKIEVNQESITEMQEETLRMTKLIEKLNEFADAQNKVFNDLKKEKINITPIIERIIKQQQKTLNEKNLDLDLKIKNKFYLNGDQNSLFQIFNNIIENAIKYNIEDGKIEIKAVRGKNNLVVSIQDSGIGISEDDLPFIFERFYRADKSRNSKNKGTGIGLAVAKELMEAHQGKIEVESNKSGTLFKLIFTKTED